MKKTLSDRVFEKTCPCGDCLIWKGAVSRDGKIPKIWYNGVTMNVRAALWLEMGRKIGKHQAINTSCGEKMCVYPGHLILDNYREYPKSVLHKARIREAMRSRSVLNMDLCNQIRESSERTSDIARRLGLPYSTVDDVRKYRKWLPTNTPFSGLGARA